MPLPVLVPVPETVIQATLLLAVHEQPGVVVTVTAYGPPLAAADCEVGDRVKPHAAAAWFTVNVRPPTVIVPVRDVVFGFAATRYETFALPEPTPPAVIVIHEAWLVAAQLQLLAADTMMRPTPPLAGRLADVVDVVTVQAPAGCETVCVCSPTVMVAVRDEVPVFAAAANVTVAAPEPLAALETTSQGAELTVVQAHPAPVVRAKDPVPPAAGMVLPVEEIEYVQGAPAWSTVNV